MSCVERPMGRGRRRLAGWLALHLSESNNTMTGPRVAHTAGEKNDRATKQTGGEESRVVGMASAKTSRDGKWEMGRVRELDLQRQGKLREVLAGGWRCGF